MYPRGACESGRALSQSRPGPQCPVHVFYTGLAHPPIVVAYRAVGVNQRHFLQLILDAGRCPLKLLCQ